ncbi:MAG: DUF1934 family protein, partial [Eggerthellaceae bacterium]
MADNAKIKLILKQTADGITDSSELFTRGEFREHGGSFFIDYDESEATGYAGSHVQLRIGQQDYTVTIQEVSLFPQGYAAVLTQTELLDEPSVIVADIGGWTVDLMRLDNRIPNAASCRSLELGMIRCIDEISEQVRRLFGLSLTTAQIESAL